MALTLNLSDVNVVRNLEKRLERLLEGVVGRAFSGRLHPAEIAGRLAREADFARFEHPSGPATANSYTLTFNPSALTIDPSELEGDLSEELEAYTARHGLRVEGPMSVSIKTSDSVAPGSLVCHAEVVPGPAVIWARLVSESTTHAIGRNRVTIGRGSDMDIVIPEDDVSRRHAVLWREGGQTFVQDLGSSNGTYVDGARLDSEPKQIEHGSTLGLSSTMWRFLERDA